MKKMFAAAVGAFCATGLLFSGCGAPSAPAAPVAPAAQPTRTIAAPLYEWGAFEGETLTLWTQKNELNRPYMQKALARYQELTKNKLVIAEFPMEEFEDALRRSLGTQEAPDVLLSYGGTIVEKLDPDENFYDFTDAPWVSDLTATSINQTIYNGNVIGLPHWEASIAGTLYNKKLFEQCQIEVPRTVDEFMAACAVLKQNGITPLYMPYEGSSMMLYQLPLDTLVQDPETISALGSGKIGYADLPGMEKIVQWYRDMADKGYLGENYEQNNWDGMSPALESGKYAMMLCWDTWLYSDYKGDPSDFGLMPAFVGVPENGTFEGPNLALLIANKHSERLDMAIDFITFMADPYNYNVAFEGFYTAPVFKQQVGSISTPQYVEVERLIEKHFRNSTAWLRIRGFSQLDAGYIQDYMHDTTGETPMDCIKRMDAARRRRQYS